MNIAINTPLPAIIDRARQDLAKAKTSAEILEVREKARTIADEAKRAARLLRAKGASDELIAAAYRMKADALELEAGAKHRLADEYDAAQERGEVSGPADRNSNSRTELNKASAIDLGLTGKDIHEARLIRDAEKVSPGIVRRVLDDQLQRGEEPTKAALRQEVIAAAENALRGGGGPRRSNKNPDYVPPSKADEAWTHVYGTARAFVEWATGENISLAICGLNERDDSQTANIRAVRKCSKILCDLVEQLDAG